MDSIPRHDYNTLFRTIIVALSYLLITCISACTSDIEKLNNLYQDKDEEALIKLYNTQLAYLEKGSQEQHDETYAFFDSVLIRNSVTPLASTNQFLDSIVCQNTYKILVKKVLSSNNSTARVSEKYECYLHTIADLMNDAADTTLAEYLPPYFAKFRSDSVFGKAVLSELYRFFNHGRIDIMKTFLKPALDNSNQPTDVFISVRERLIKYDKSKSYNPDNSKLDSYRDKMNYYDNIRTKFENVFDSERKIREEIEELNSEIRKHKGFRLEGIIISVVDRVYGTETYEISTYSSRNHALLITTETKFTTKGRFSIDVVKAGTREVRVKEEMGGFDQTWNVYREVKQEEIQEVNKKKRKIRELRNKLNEPRNLPQVNYGEASRKHEYYSKLYNDERLRQDAKIIEMQVQAHNNLKRILVEYE